MWSFNKLGRSIISVIFLEEKAEVWKYGLSKATEPKVVKGVRTTSPAPIFIFPNAQKCFHSFIRQPLWTFFSF